MVTVDGSMGEGGGQVLRTALALSLLTGRDLEIHQIRAGRSRPGLAPQHLAAVRAAAAVGAAAVEGDEPGSGRLRFRPAGTTPGEHLFDVGTAGSAILVLQTVLVPLCLAAGPSRLLLTGGTHNPRAPSFEFLREAWLPLINRLGPRVDARLLRRGFYPAGGGELEVTVEPAARLGRLELVERGSLECLAATAVIARLPRHIAERELRLLGRQLDLGADALAVEADATSAGPGNAVSLTVASAAVTEVFTAVGRRGVPAERVASGVVAAARRYLDAGVAVGEHLADQLLLPLAAGEGGVFSTLPLTSHATTAAAVLTRFVDVEVRTTPRAQEGVEVEVVGAAGAG